MPPCSWHLFLMAMVMQILIGAGAPGSATGNESLEPAGRQAPKAGILLVAFGSSRISAQASLSAVDAKVTAAYPKMAVRWAYTSHVVREGLAQRKVLDSPALALARMLDEHFSHVAVQSLHTVPGSEYDDLRCIVNGFKTMNVFDRIALGRPLMGTQEDLAAIVKSFLEVIPEARKENEAVVLMGHGTRHPANAFYAALMYQLQLQDPNIFVGTVAGFPDIRLITAQLQARRIQRAYLMPFMAVAGVHARNDMAGGQADSWKSILAQAGIEGLPVLKGTAEYEGFVDIWMGHLREAVAELGL